MSSNIIDENIMKYMDENIPLCKGDLGTFQKKCYEESVPIIDNETAKLLEVTLTISKPKNILEIGCAVGFSSIFMQSVVKDAKITTIERYPVMIEKAKENFKNFNTNINLIQGDAVEVLETLEGSYDFIFMDAGKGQYINMINNCFRLLKKDGTIFIDDIFQNGNIVQPIEDIPKRQRTIHRRMNSLVNTMLNTKGLKSTLIPIADGVIIGHKTCDKIELR